MKIKVRKRDFLEILHRVLVVASRGIDTRTSSILLDVADRIGVMANNLEIGVVGYCIGEILEGGRVLVSARKLYDVVKNMGEDIEVSSLGGSEVEVKSGESVFVLNAGLASEFFEVKLDGCEVEFDLSVGELCRMIDRVIFVISRADQHMWLTDSVKVHNVDGYVRMISSDNKRLAVVRSDSKVGDWGVLKDGVVFSKQSIMCIRRGIDAIDGVVNIGLSQSGSVVKVGNMVWSIRLLSRGGYPNYEQLIDRKLDKMMRVSCKQLMEVMRRVSVLLDGKFIVVKWNIGDGMLEVSCEHPDWGRCYDKLPVDYSGSREVIGFNGRYILDLLGVWDVDEIDIYFNDSISFIKVLPVGIDGHMYIFMPVML